MKPLKLDAEAFGAFAGHISVDFEALAPRGLYLISGDTGTGKTTLFDAMCWALYGSLPRSGANRSGSDDKVRSDYVDEATRCEVRFTFECDGERYTVVRNAEYTRPKMVGQGVRTEPASAVLVHHRPGEDHEVATKAKPVTAACTDLLGLDATQFQRVVLLPQGEFSRFLLANSTEREGLLAKLFGSGVFDSIVAQLKAEQERLRADLAATEQEAKGWLHQAAQHLTRAEELLEAQEPVDGVQPALRTGDAEAPLSSEQSAFVPEPDPAVELERLQQQLTRVDAAHAEVQQAATRARARAGDARAKAARASEAAARFDKAAVLRSSLDELANAETEIARAEAAARASAAARPVVKAAEAFDEAEEQCRKATATLLDRRSSIEAAFAHLGLEVSSDEAPLMLERRRHSLAEDCARQRGALQGHADAVAREADARTEVDEVSKAVVGCGNDRDLARADVERSAAALAELGEPANELEVVGRQLEERQAAVGTRADLDEQLVALQQVEQAQVEAASRARDTLDRYLASTAPRLAEQLVEGEPCPVCGSVDHPEPATAADAGPVSWDAVEGANEASQRADECVSELRRRIGELRGRLGEAADTPCNVLRSQCAELTDQQQVLRARFERKAEVESELRDRQRSVTDAETTLVRLTERQQQVNNELDAARVAAEAARAAAAGIDEGALATRESGLRALAEQLGGYDDIVTRAARAEEAVERAKQVLAEATHEAAGVDVTTARAALMPAEDEARALDAATKHAADRAAAESGLQTLREQGVPEERPAVDELAVAAEQAEVEAGARDRTATEVGVHRDTAAEALKLIGDSDEQTQVLRAATEVARRAHEVCSGSSAQRVPLPRWVLAHELDRVLAAANAHLSQMTADRYTLERATEAADRRKSAGLDLLVADTHTGRKRPPTTLSGGETFQASLALALGLADVVSQGGTAGGHRFEALFVDEGFGSLSEEALDEAIRALEGLHATGGRTVGAITHVASMKEAMHVGIEVRRAPDGRGSEVLVHV